MPSRWRHAWNAFRGVRMQPIEDALRSRLIRAYAPFDFVSAIYAWCGGSPRDVWVCIIFADAPPDCYEIETLLERAWPDVFFRFVRLQAGEGEDFSFDGCTAQDLAAFRVL